MSVPVEGRKGNDRTEEIVCTLKNGIMKAQSADWTSEKSLACDWSIEVEAISRR